MNNNYSNSTVKISLFSRGISRGKLKILNDFIFPGRVLDIGCGNGLYGVHVASLGCEVEQIDLEDRRDQKAINLPFHIMNAENIELPENSFDHVIAFDIMEHLDDDKRFLKAVLKICKYRLFLSVPNADDEQIVKLGLTHKHHKDKTHRREYFKEQLEILLGENGFKVLSIRPNYADLCNFAKVLAKDKFYSKVAAKILSLQCKILIQIGLFENSTIGDWYCVAEKI